ncbi:rhodanese-like domain-containing protein [Paenibacillus sp. MBLB4367]|uniref:rhodanese-like domain-containing protein n=1 Tax=Paenibacillus sp. MBLB4367 TaxID=3384767 RepID=UPI0039082293
MHPIGTITPTELKARLEKGEALTMIDVREDEEVAAGMIPGAKHIPLGQLPLRHGEIPQSGEIIMICRSGNRSGKACDFLQQQGFAGLKNMTGGMLDWE